MPLLPPTAPRVRLHQRQVTLDGYKRADGMWDLEAHLVDCKDQTYRLASGVRQPGEAVHDLWVRVTIDGEHHFATSDATLMNAVDVGIAMGNAPDFLKEKADYVTDSIDHDGVVTALEHFGLI